MTAMLGMPIVGQRPWHDRYHDNDVRVAAGNHNNALLVLACAPRIRALATNPSTLGPVFEGAAWQHLHSQARGRTAVYALWEDMASISQRLHVAAHVMWGIVLDCP